MLSFLPPRYRSAWRHSASGSLVRAAAVSGFLEMVAFGTLYIVGFVSAFTHLAVIGPLAFVEYLFYPKSWPLAFFFFDGTIRWLTSLSGQAVGSLALYPAAWIHGWLERRAERRRRGPKVPDIIERGDGTRYELRISSCRPKGNWDKWMTVMYEERLYEIAAAELGQPPRPYLYLLRTKPESKVIRGLHRYDPNEVFQEEWP
ncbi:MAG: hypothetical protein AUH88_03485 [Acidobacteria bacterium 13_1_40CM_4_61_5]|nr:MAG: hypothetical protein AUH88_03485 [Acidobacteria bacterium 13_1_40CM_4_61_5]PYU06768.1 MAG: hypothetical protein DMG33_06895 [Acidobacteriota bacterium]